MFGELFLILCYCYMFQEPTIRVFVPKKRVPSKTLPIDPISSFLLLPCVILILTFNVNQLSRLGQRGPKSPSLF